MRRCSVLPLLLLVATCALLVATCVLLPRALSLLDQVELNTTAGPEVLCSFRRHPPVKDNASQYPFVLSLDNDGRLATLFCLFEGDLGQLQANASEHDSNFTSTTNRTDEPPSRPVTLGSWVSACVQPTRDLPDGDLDLLLDLSTQGVEQWLGEPFRMACLLAPAGDSARLMLRFKRVSPPVLECWNGEEATDDVIMSAFIPPPPDSSSHYRFHFKGDALGAMLRQLSAIHGWDLGSHTGGLPTLTLMCR